MLLFEGLKVLDVGTWIAGPVSTTILADFGADVIKVEIPGEGDPYRKLPHGPATPKADVNYTWLLDARNKRSITLNLKSREGKEVLKKLVSNCDVYVTNQPMGVRRSLGLTYDELKSLNSRMIYASLTAYGETGPEAEKEGFDGQAYWARSGLQDLVRATDAPPGNSVAGMGDHPTAVTLFSAIMMGLYRRQLTGEGTMVSTSLLANGFWSNSCMGQAALAGADFSPRTNRRPEEVPWTRRYYEAADGRLLQLAMVRSPVEQEVLLEELGLISLLEDPRFTDPNARLDNSQALSEALQEKLIERHSQVWIDLFASRGVNLSRLATVQDMLQDEQAIAVGVLTPPREDIGVDLVINTPQNVLGVTRVGPKRAPEVGEHTDEVLAELGYSIEEIKLLRQAGAT